MTKAKDWNLSGIADEFVDDRVEIKTVGTSSIRVVLAVVEGGQNVRVSGSPCRVDLDNDPDNWCFAGTWAQIHIPARHRACLGNMAP